jgi:hypothetical protein
LSEARTWASPVKREAVGIGGEGVGQDLDGDLAAEVGVGGAYTVPMPPSPSLAVIR